MALSSSCQRAPSSPASAKPEEKIITVLACFSTAWRMTSTTCAAGTATSTKSTGPGMAESEGKASRPCTFSRFGLTG